MIKVLDPSPVTLLCFKTHCTTILKWWAQTDKTEHVHKMSAPWISKDKIHALKYVHVYLATGCSSWRAERIHLPLRLSIACPVSLVNSTWPPSGPKLRRTTDSNTDTVCRTCSRWRCSTGCIATRRLKVKMGEGGFSIMSSINNLNNKQSRNPMFKTILIYCYYYRQSPINAKETWPSN